MFSLAGIRAFSPLQLKENAMHFIVSLPDGYNGHSARFTAAPVKRDGNLLKLHSAEPGKGYLIRWVHIDDYKKALTKEGAEPSDLELLMQHIEHFEQNSTPYPSWVCG